MTIKVAKTTDELPYYAQRMIRRLAPHLRASMTKAVQQKLDEATAAGRHPTAEELAGCAFAVVFGDSDCDKRMENSCIEAYDNQKSTRLQKVIDELRARVARPAKVSYR